MVIMPIYLAHYSRFLDKTNSNFENNILAVATRISPHKLLDSEATCLLTAC